MKTTTIFNAWCTVIIWPNDERSKRQADKFYTALLRRIEAGDRAREALNVFADIWYPVDIEADDKKDHRQ